MITKSHPLRATRAFVMATALLFSFTASSLLAQSIPQTALYILDAAGHVTTLTAPSGPGTIIFPAGGGTLLTGNALGTITIGTWQATPIGLAYGGTGASNASGIAQNAFFAGPSLGGVGAAGFRSITAADVPVFVASGSSHAAGAVPDPGSTSGTTRFLREDATWAAPGGSGGNDEIVGSTVNEPLSQNTNPDYWDPGASSVISGPAGSIVNGTVMIVTRTGTIKNFWMALSAKTGSSSKYWIFTLVDVTTGANGPTVNVGGTSATAKDVSNTLLVSAGDQITLVQTWFGNPTASTTATWAFELQ